MDGVELQRRQGCWIHGYPDENQSDLRMLPVDSQEQVGDDLALAALRGLQVWRLVLRTLYFWLSKLTLFLSSHPTLPASSPFGPKTREALGFQMVPRPE